MDRELPSLWEFIRVTIFSLLWDDVFFFYSHWLLHQGVLFKYIHKIVSGVFSEGVLRCDIDKITMVIDVTPSTMSSMHRLHWRQYTPIQLRPLSAITLPLRTCTAPRLFVCFSFVLTYHTGVGFTLSMVMCCWRMSVVLLECF